MMRRLSSLMLVTALCLVPLAGALHAADTPKQGKVPHDATGRCGDGTWTSAGTKQGACSQHGGVKAWFGKAPKGTAARCQDGTWSKTAGQGACSGHGGVDYKLDQKPASH